MCCPSGGKSLGTRKNNRQQTYMYSTKKSTKKYSFQQED